MERRRVTTTMRARIGGALLVAGLLGGVGVAQAQQAEAIQPNTVWFSTKSQCVAARPLYSTSFTRITQDCTYVGAKLFGWHLESGPWILVYTTR